MLFLPHSSLYMARQSCSAIRNLTDDFKFQAFRTDILRRSEEHSCITKCGFDELRKIQEILLRRSLCTPCGRLFDLGELESRLKELWRPRYCTGCGRNHPTLLFPQGQKVVHKCVGLLGKLAVCKHLKASGKVEPCIGSKTTVHCPDPEHILIGRKDSGDLPEFQKYSAGIAVDPTSQRAMEAEVFRTFPLAKVNRQQYSEVETLKRHLMNQIRQLEPGSLCPHASNQHDSIVSCLVSDDCVLSKYCSYDLELPAFHGPYLRYWTRLDCPGHQYCCRYCGAKYFWVLDTDYVALQVQLRIRNVRLDGMDWLSNLTFDTEDHPIFNSYTEGILWCSDPSCGTNHGHRWLKMVEIFERSTLDWDRIFVNLLERGPEFMVTFPLSLEYRTFEETSFWEPGLTRWAWYID
ncbi:hypothetical protein FPCIR_13305 [Fusarium pseudocircinatum]|uniref:Uncharacterized protein n=1 Tax=Fusarium pseudocircinatum TaxID=56676 RepID=A0A8H5KJR2_9HYPO|nr:hypothetical protein FPCIR_13305 [Fusarium pseudocircinatum]